MNSTYQIAGDSILLDVPLTSWDPYGQLLKTMMPRALNIAIYDAAGEVLWLSDGTESTELHELLEKALEQEQATHRHSLGIEHAMEGTSGYVFLLRDEQQHCLGVVVLTCVERNAQRRSFDVVYSLLRPALEVLSRELTNRYSIGSLQKDLMRRNGDIELLLGDFTATEHQEDTDDFGSVIQNCVIHLGCQIGVLLVPEKNIAIFRVGEGVTASAGAEVLTRTHRHLFALLQVRHRTITLNKVAESGPLAAVPYKILACPVLFGTQRVVGVLAIFKSASECDFEARQIHIAELLARRAAHMLQQAYDAATGLLTRPAFEQRAMAAMAVGTHNRTHCVIYIDIDRLHVLNERLGMHVGDEIIARVADVVRNNLTQAMVATLVHGDRLAIFLPETELPNALQYAELLRRGISQINYIAGNKKIDITVSGGVACVEPSEHPVSHALANAEMACRVAKDNGRNRVEALQGTDSNKLRNVADLAIVETVRTALESDRFRLDAQLIDDLQQPDKPRNFELLLRMLDENGEVIPPNKFLPAAERYQMMPAIDRWVVQFVLEMLAAAAPKLVRLDAHFAVNISGQSLNDEGFCEFLENALRTYALSPSLLSFEFTEAAVVTSVASAEALMRKLGEMGYDITLDDCGRGLSSFTYLQSLPITCVKIDGSLVRDMVTNLHAQTVVGAIVQMAHTLQLATTAECIESSEIQRIATELGINYGQGFAVGRPRPLEAVLQALLCNQTETIRAAADKKIKRQA